MNDRDITFRIPSSVIVKILVILAVTMGVWYLRDLVLVILTAVVIASAIEPAVRRLVLKKIPRVFAVLIVYVSCALFFIGLAYFFIPSVLSETIGLLTELPNYVAEVERADFGPDAIIDSATIVKGLSLDGLVRNMQLAFVGISNNFLGTVSIIFGGLFSFILVIVFSFYFAVQEQGIDDFLRIITPTRHKKYVVNLWKRSQRKIGLWMQGQLLLGVIIGMLVYLGLTILGVKYALVLAVLAALFELIPVFGPILAAVPAVAIGFVGGGVSLALFIIALYVIIQQFENHLIYPLVVTKVVGVPPLLVILALLVGAKLAGFIGILLSVPFAAAIQEFVSDLEHRRSFVLGETDE